jgi:hypothetical protein
VQEAAAADVPEQPAGSVPALDEAPVAIAAESADMLHPPAIEHMSAGEPPAAAVVTVPAADAAVSEGEGGAASESMSQPTHDVEDFQAQVLSRLDRIEALLGELRAGVR